jgi:glycosyltransferase involved in cell wall biosynthesis
VCRRAAGSPGFPNIPAVPGPRVSVVIPTFERPARLRALLESLRHQTVDIDEFEVIVVDDASGPETIEVLAAAERSGLPLRHVRFEHQQGPAAARNAGWRLARAPWVAFTDDDCTASPSWLRAALDAVREGDRLAAIQGRTEPDPADALNRGLFSRTVRVDRLGPQFETCNIVYRRSVLEALGGFDERFGAKPAAEDTDLAWRVLESGREITFAPEALVRHAVEPVGAVALLRTALRWRPAVRVFADHPGARVILYRSVFWNVWHYLLWRSLLSLIGPRWLSRPLITMHLLQLRRRAALEGAGAWAVPFLLVHDLVECGAIARGAILYRTLVL